MAFSSLFCAAVTSALLASSADEKCLLARLLRHGTGGKTRRQKDSDRR